MNLTPAENFKKTPDGARLNEALNQGWLQKAAEVALLEMTLGQGLGTEVNESLAAHHNLVGARFVLHILLNLTTTPPPQPVKRNDTLSR